MSNQDRAAKALLRARGGISLTLSYLVLQMHSSPRTRRYFRLPQRLPFPVSLFSAHAEVFPLFPARVLAQAALLRARGGISVAAAATRRRAVSSPRTRRYFRWERYERDGLELFSAHAEVFPTGHRRCMTPEALLRARGGISASIWLDATFDISSPRTRRYFRVWCNTVTI